MDLSKLNKSRLLILIAAFVLTFPLFSTRAWGAPPSISLLHSFGDGSVANDGHFCGAALIKGLDGNFYGTTISGGSTVAADPAGLGFGSIFKMTPAGVVTIVHSFKDGSVANDGAHPYDALTIGSDGNFYGTTHQGGSADLGTVFKMTQAGVVTILHSFGDGSVTNDGAFPYATLVEGVDGAFYGTTFNGGSATFGTIFKTTPAGVTTILHSFADGSITGDGFNPYASLIKASDGKFYGTTFEGGTAGDGTAFQMTPAGTVTILHSFVDGTVTNDGSNPVAGLMEASDGNFYGTTDIGGSANAGTVFKMTSAGAVTILHSFLDGSVTNDGANPFAALLQGADGTFYGTTNNGGLGFGSVFNMTAAGVVTILHKCGDPGTITGPFTNDGSTPVAALLEDSDGHFYGTTQNGGSASFGSIFRLSTLNFVVSLPANTTAGIPFNITVTAFNFAGNVATGYGGTVHFTSDDPTATLPADITLTNGTGKIQATLTRATTVTIRARDTNDIGLTGTGSTIVAPNIFDHLTVTAPATSNTGSGIAVTVSARDQYENIVPTFGDTLHFTSTDPTAVLPADTTLTNGSKQFTVKYKTPGIQTVTVTDAAHPAFATTSSPTTVTAVLAKFLITGPATTVPAASNVFTVTATDAIGNKITGYSGTVHFAITDPAGAVSPDTTLVNGKGTFHATFKTAGTQKVTATDTANSAIQGIVPIVVNAGPVTKFIVTAPATIASGDAFYSQITATDKYSNPVTSYSGTVHFTSTDPLAVLPADVTLTNGTRQVSIKLKTPGSQKFTATDTVTATIKGVSPAVTVH